MVWSSPWPLSLRNDLLLAGAHQKCQAISKLFVTFKLMYMGESASLLLDKLYEIYPRYKENTKQNASTAIF
jgi:hypothetical protein